MNYYVRIDIIMKTLHTITCNTDSEWYAEAFLKRNIPKFNKNHYEIEGWYVCADLVRDGKVIKHFDSRFKET